MRAQIAGAGHVAVIERDGQVITETLVSRPVRLELPDALLALEPGERAHTSLPLPGWVYLQETAISRLGPREMLALQEALLCEVPDSLSFRFAPDERGRSAVSAVSWSCRPSLVVLAAVHTYPADGTVVITSASCKLIGKSYAEDTLLP